MKRTPAKHWTNGALRMALGLAVLVGSMASASGSAAGSGRGSTGNVRGRVIAHDTGRPIAGATIVLPAYGLSTTSDPGGWFAFPDPVATDAPARRITAVVTAPGWGRWSIRRVPLYPNDTLNLRAELRATPFDHAVLSPTERAAAPRPPLQPSSYTETCTGWKAGQTPPETISVYITDDKKAVTYDFMFYVTHVLPNEWIPSWDEDSLGAGAIAAKTYGWYRAKPNHAFSGGDGCADVQDSVSDQVFDPSWDSDFTNQAVYATMGSVLWKDGNTFLAQYFAGAPGDPCAPVEGQFAGRMSQWGTQTCALDSMLWPEISTTFYDDNGDTEWLTLQDLLLNPGAENSQLYAWLLGTGGGSIARVKGGAYAGDYYLSLTSTNTGRLYQDRPFLGEPTTKYHFEVATRCGTENSKDCTITLKVVAIAEDGSRVEKFKKVTENNDGVWRKYTYDPAASGIVHVTARWRISSEQDIGVDAAVLSGPFGGP